MSCFLDCIVAIEAGFRPLSKEEKVICNQLVIEAYGIIDAYNECADPDKKMLVATRMVRRALGSDDNSVPMGANQGSMSGLGYSQSWTFSANGGSYGELYLSRVEKKMLGVGNKIGSYGPLMAMMER